MGAPFPPTAETGRARGYASLKNALQRALAGTAGRSARRRRAKAREKDRVSEFEFSRLERQHEGAGGLPPGGCIYGDVEIGTGVSSQRHPLPPRSQRLAFDTSSTLTLETSSGAGADLETTSALGPLSEDRPELAETSSVAVRDAEARTRSARRRDAGRAAPPSACGCARSCRRRHAPASAEDAAVAAILFPLRCLRRKTAGTLARTAAASARKAKAGRIFSRRCKTSQAETG